MDNRQFFGRYLQRELNKGYKMFGLEISLRWREQILENQDKVEQALQRELSQGKYYGYYRRK